MSEINSSKHRREGLDDQVLLKRYRDQKDPCYVDTLFRRYLHLVYGLCLTILENKVESRDVTMEIFERILVRLQHEEIKHFPRWIYSVTKNACIDHRRKTKTRRNRVESMSVEASPSQFLVENDGWLRLIKSKSLVDQIPEALKSLKSEQRQCIELFYFKRKSYREIAKIGGWSLMEVRSHIQNGKRNLRNWLQK